MFSGPRRIIAVAALVAILFAVGLTRLFMLRFEGGDVYPPYSSLRTDPLGTEVLMDSLNQVVADSTRRNFRSPDLVPLTPQTTLLVLGLAGNDFFLGSPKVGRLMERLAASGGDHLFCSDHPV